MRKLESISAFFPAYNDAATISSMVIATLLTLPQVTDDYEVIVVNDGSPDHTGEMLKELARVYPQVRVITHEKNRGYGGALRSGFGAATKTWIFYTDGDAQYDPRELPRLVEAVTEDCDVVNGVQDRPLRPPPSYPDRKALPYDRPISVRISFARCRL